MVGIDVVALERFRATLARSPALAKRFFTPAELAYCQGAASYDLHLAATFAAKEAVMKMLNLTPAAAWMRAIEIIRTPSGAPVARVGGKEYSLSISHDGPVVIAVAVL